MNYRLLDALTIEEIIKKPKLEQFRQEYQSIEHDLLVLNYKIKNLDEYYQRYETNCYNEKQETCDTLNTICKRHKLIRKNLVLLTILEIMIYIKLEELTIAYGCLLMQTTFYVYFRCQDIIKKEQLQKELYEYDIKIEDIIIEKDKILKQQCDKLSNNTKRKKILEREIDTLTSQLELINLKRLLQLIPQELCFEIPEIREKIKLY